MYEGMYVCMYKALRTAGGIRRPLRSLRKEKYIELREAGRGPRLSVVLIL